MKATSKLVGSLVCAAAFVLAASQASAVNLVLNPGFETGDFTSWLVLGATGTVQTPDNGPAAAGTHNAFLDNQTQAANLALQQTTANGTAVGAGILVNYSFDLKQGVSANGGVVFVHIFDQNSGGGVISQGPGLLGPNFAGIGDGQWHTYTGSFTTVAGSDHLTIEIDATTGAAAGSIEQVHVDNVQLNVVPEPATLSLVGLGLLGMLMVRRSRKS